MFAGTVMVEKPLANLCPLSTKLMDSKQVASLTKFEITHNRFDHAYVQKKKKKLQLDGIKDRN